MKRKLLIYALFSFFYTSAVAQKTAVIPKAKTKEEQKEARKKMTLEQKIESIAPVDITLPSAKVSLPGESSITSVEDAKKYVSETLPEIGLKVKKKAKKAKEIAKQAAKVFDGKQYHGIGIEKHILKRGSGSRLSYTEFYTSKKNDEIPNPYIKNIFWFDEKKQKVVEALTRERSTNQLMHGPYKEYRGETLLEEGYYYLGTKDGIWAKYDKDFSLIEKKSYDRGFLEGSKITYYDADSTKIKEVMPNWFGKTTGDYFLFHENGTLAEQGQYDNGVKIGKWVEYYDAGNRRKKEMQYGSDCFDTTEPYLVREYDAAGKMIYQKQ